jgi:hypothetical protein
MEMEPSGIVEPDDSEEREHYRLMLAREDWRAAYYTLPNPSGSAENKLRFLLRYGPRIPVDLYGGLLHDAYKNAFNGLDSIGTDELRRLFEHPGSAGVGVRSGHGIEELPSQLILYRGYHRPNLKLRFSWSTAVSDAARFALLWHQQSGDEPRIVEAEAAKADVIAFIPFEREIIIDPERVTVTADYAVPKDLWLQWGYADEWKTHYAAE